jgi:hypothetical protein
MRSFGKQIKKDTIKFSKLAKELLRYGIELKCITDASSRNSDVGEMTVLVKASGEIDSDRSRDVVEAIKATGDWAGYSALITFASYISGGKWSIGEWGRLNEYDNETS